VTWVLGNLAGITATPSTYMLMFLPLNGIQDAAGNAMTVLPDDFWTVLPPLTADIIDVAPDPRSTPVDSVNIVFSAPVRGFDLGDLQLLSRNGDGTNLLTPAQTLTSADNVTWTLGNLAGLTGPLGAGYLLSLVAAGSGITDTAGNPLTGSVSEEWRVADVFGRFVFYNNSSFDGGNPAADAADDAAIATDKTALLPGAGAATFANYTSYSKGINGIIIDIAGLPPGGARGPIASDFAFRVGNSSDRSTWIDGPAPTFIRHLHGAGVGGSDRILITWADGTIRNQWLEVTVKSNSVTGLVAPDVFSFGNLVGDTGDGTATAVVNALDLAAVKRALNAAANITSRLDFDRSGRINALDLAAVKANLNRSLSLQPAAAAAPAATFGAVPVSAPEPLRVARIWDESSGALLA
jgi:hypothetical protein